MKRTIIITILAFILAFSLGVSLKDATIEARAQTMSSQETFVMVAETMPPVVTVPEVTEPEPIVLEMVNNERTIPTNLEEVEKMLEAVETQVEAASNIYNGLITLGYAEDHPAVVLAKAEVENRKADYDYYYDYVEDFKWTEREIEYPDATYIWKTLKSYGWNDYVCAGIMGNIMAEVGGQTLTLHALYSTANDYYYGMCQWNRGGYPQVYGTGLDTQCEVLRDTIEYEFNSFAWVYESGFSFEAFLALEDEQQAALAFMEVCERCGPDSAWTRMQNATEAYNYFVS